MRLKELRTLNNMNQQKLANMLGVSRSTIAMWETDKSQPDNDMLIKISNLFNCSIDYLLGNTDTPTLPSQNKNTKPGTFELIGSDGSRTEMNVREYDAVVAILKAMREENKNQKG